MIRDSTYSGVPGNGPYFGRGIICVFAIGDENCGVESTITFVEELFNDVALPIKQQTNDGVRNGKGRGDKDVAR